MKAVVIGPGRVGCGFAGQVLRASGYEVVFLARNPHLVAHFNRVGRYIVRLVGQVNPAQEILVDGIRAVALSDLDGVVREISGADIVATAVTVGGLSDVARPIAAGLRERVDPTHVLAFENLIDAGPHLRALVARHLPDTGRHVFSSALVSRAIASRLGHLAYNDPLTFVGDEPDTFVVDGRGVHPPFPPIEGMAVVENYRAHALSKLYTFSAGHAATAYLGHLKGYRYIHSAIRDPEIRAAVLATMQEGRRALLAAYGPESAGRQEDLDDIVARFENAGLSDPVSRVGRDPRRKLGSADRLAGAATLAERFGFYPVHLTFAIAAALCFEHEDDSSSATLQYELAAGGVARVLRQVCGFKPGSRLERDVAAARARLVTGWPRGNPLLQFPEMPWLPSSDRRSLGMAGVA